ncbi:MAG: sensor histidine kinase, partial [Flavobacteriales bacterium]
MKNPLGQKKNKAPKGVLIYLLGFYVLLQFVWWAYMLVSLNSEIYQLKLELLTSSSFPGPEQLILKGELDEKLSLRIWMVLGEGAVFMLILILGFRSVRRSIAKELLVAEQQKNFLLSVTHELKSPLAAIKLQLQTLQSRKLPEDKVAQLYSRALGDANRLEKLVENLLLVNKIEDGRLPLEMEKVNLSNHIESLVAESFGYELEAGKITLQIEKDLVAKADKMALDSVVLNLIDNALKYGDNSRVEVVLATAASNEIQLSVSDLGDGIPNAEKEKIFERFYRRGNEDVRKTKGTGIGLYLVKLLVLEHQGEISVVDNEPKGAKFV